MTWLLPRILILCVGVGLGVLVGWWVPGLSALLCAGVGLSAALAVIVARDTYYGYRLVTWLRESLDSAAPHSSGLWGELGYRVERALRQREHGTALERERLTQFLSAIEASPNGVLMLDAGEQIEWCNSVAADHFGLDPQRDRLQRVTNLVRAPAFVSYLQSGRYDEPIQMPAPNGHHTLSVLVRPYGDGQRLVLSLDVTERERADAMRRDFVANVSHEIRTPLTVLSGFIETMTNLSLTPVEYRRVLALMAQQAQRMGTLVNDLLTLAQLEGSPRPNADRWVALEPLLGQVAADARALSAGRHTLVFPVHVNAQIAGAHSELLSAITNLVNNAVRYTPERGRIEVAWRMHDGAGELLVTDSGPGIAREHLPRLTERFYRVDGSRSRETGGTGLGLSIVKHVVQRHGGELDIHSEVGHGSTFRLVFPAARVREGAGAAPPASPEVARGEERVLP